MALRDWIVDSGKAATATPAISATHRPINTATVATVATVAVANPENEIDSLPDPLAEVRRQRVLAMLAEQPGIQYAVITDTKADPEAVILALAIRGQATCELRIPRDKYDGVLLLDLIERHIATLH